MIAIPKTRISSMEALKAERLRLKRDINILEHHFNEVYAEMENKVRSVDHVISIVAKFGALFKGSINNDPKDARKSPVFTVLKVAVPVLAGGLFIKHKRKNLLKSVFGYTLGQAAKYVMSKNVSE